MSTMNILSATLIALILATCVTLVVGVQAVRATSDAAPQAEFSFA